MKKLLFEHKVCGRCCGSGYYGPTCVYGGLCFKCHGRGSVLTKRGAAANAVYAASLRVPASAIKVGEKILYEGFSAGSLTVPSKWCAVTEIKAEGDTLTLVTDGCTFANLPHDSPVRKAWTAEEKAPKIAAAKAFEATLGKSGKPLKKAKAAAARCPDCGEPGEIVGHQTCQYPKDHA